MRSRAHIKSHPLHPMLIAFPLAFLVGMLVADLVGLAAGAAGFWSGGAYLSVAAIVTGVAAAIPGLIDYVYTVPPDTPAKKRTTSHMLVNSSALVAAAGGMAFRDWGSLEPGGVTVMLEFVSVGLVSYGGWLGRTLGYRNQIAVRSTEEGTTPATLNLIDSPE